LLAVRALKIENNNGGCVSWTVLPFCNHRGRHSCEEPDKILCSGEVANEIRCSGEETGEKDVIKPAERLQKKTAENCSGEKPRERLLPLLIYHLPFLVAGSDKKPIEVQCVVDCENLVFVEADSGEKPGEKWGLHTGEEPVELDFVWAH
jgi:hypothetical protein